MILVDHGRKSTMTMRAESLFYVSLALIMMLVLLVGFAPSFFLRPWLGKTSSFPPLTPILMAHGLVFTAWIGLFATQAGLVSAGLTNIHRRLGWLGMLLLPALLVLGFLAAGSGVARGVGLPSLLPHSWLADVLLTLCTFVLLFALALHRRHDPQSHKRLMLLGMCPMMASAYIRMPWFDNTWGSMILPDLPILALLAWDWRTRGHPHWATIGGGTLVLLSQTLPPVIWQTATWLTIARWLVPT